MTKRHLKKLLPLITLFMTFNLASKNILLSPNDKLSIPLPLPYNGSIYSEEDIKKFMESSIQKSRQPVIIFGANWCPDCRILDGTLQIPTIQKFINDHYDVMHIDVGRYDKNMELMDFFGIVKEKGVPRVLVFDKKNNLLNSSTTKEWTTARERSSQDIFNYFQKLVM